MTADPAETSSPQPSGGPCPRNSNAVSFNFILADEDVDHCADMLNRLSGAKTTDEMLHIIYLDTPDDAIARLGLGFSIRRRGGTGSRRGGWKRFVEALSPATPKTARRTLAACLQQAASIEVVARTETRRRVWSFSCGGMAAEGRLDRSSVVMNDKKAVLGSFRLTCDAPNVEFFRLVTEACAPDRLRLSAESDLARAYRLCDGPNAPYVTAFAPDLNATMDAETAFRTIATACFNHFLLNETAIRAKGDREAVHQCRVALRRLSACLRLFSGFIGGADYEALRTDLKELGTYLRNARDLDVMIADVIAPALAADPPAGTPALMREIEARRTKAYADLVARLWAPASAALFLRLALWLEAGDWTSSADPKSLKRRGEPIAKYARQKFERMKCKFAERCAGLGQANREERHSTRIHAKNLRYGTEFFATLAPGKMASKRMLAFIHAVKTLQTVLGDWNDILMARQFLASFGPEPKIAPEAEARSDIVVDLQPGMRWTAALNGSSTLIAAANALAYRIKETPETEFCEKSTKACRSLHKLKPFWTQLG